MILREISAKKPTVRSLEINKIHCLAGEKAYSRSLYVQYK